MQSTIFCGVLLLLISSAESQEECKDQCAKSNDDHEKVDACREGCRLQIILAFTASGDVASTRDECHSGCEKSYTNKELATTCAKGCDYQPEMKNAKSVQIAISNKDPTFDVARSAMERMMMDMRGPFGFMRGMRTLFDSDDPWVDFHRRMHHEMMRFHQIADNILNMQNAQNMMPNIAIHRPQGHEDKALEGPQVGNKDKSGEAIIAAAPVESKSSMQLLGHQGENPVIVESTESSFLSRLAARARRLSVLSQWLVSAALFLCLISMISISIAIIRQIKSQRYHNLRNAAVIVPQTFAEPLPAKKVPLETPPANIDYPLIHDTPPPAYDQLSVHKEKPASGPESDPKV